MKAGGLLMGMVFWMAAGSVRAENPRSGLAGLDAAMNGTGRVGDLSPRSDGPIGAPSIPEERAVPKAPRAAPAAARPDERVLPPEATALSEEEYLQTEGPVANCRIEVARRRRVAPSQVSAGTVVLRFTVERSGRVRNAEAIWAANTDLEVAACAKRVLSDWTFAKHPTGDVTVERVYRVGGARPMGPPHTSLTAFSQ